LRIADNVNKNYQKLLNQIEDFRVRAPVIKFPGQISDLNTVKATSTGDLMKTYCNGSFKSVCGLRGLGAGVISFKPAQLPLVPKKPIRSLVRCGISSPVHFIARLSIAIAVVSGLCLGQNMNISPANVTMVAGQSQQFSVKSAKFNVTWSLSTAIGTISNSGLYTAPSVVDSQQTVTVTAKSSSGKSGQANVTLQPVQPVSVTINPASAKLAAAQTMQFTTAVSGTSNTAVTWTLSPAVGSISSAGLYTAPSTTTSTQSVTVTAISAADPTKSASATIAVNPSVAVSITPASATLTAAQTQQLSAIVTGTSNTGVTWTLTPSVGTLSTAGLYTAPTSVTSQQTMTVTATSAADTTKTATATVTVVPPQLAITTATLPNGTTGVPYSATLAATGGMTPYTWSLVSGALPAGLSLTFSGVIAGTPTTVTQYKFAVQATDTLGNKASQSYAMVVAAPSSVTWGPTYYVSGQYGNDNWSGLVPSSNSSNTDGPFKTLAKAQAAMRLSSTVKAVTIRGGTYSIASTLSLNWADSGELWISYPGETVILDGGGTGGVLAGGVNNLTIEGLTIQNTYAAGSEHGLYIGYSTNATIRWNKFLNCKNACITGAGVNGAVIDSNIFDGQSPGQYFALNLWYGSSNNRITHNLVQNCQGGGIAFGAGPFDPPNNNNIVDRNILRNIDTNTTDQGALYMLDRTHLAVGNQITNNIVNGNGGTSYLTNWTKAIYIDDLMSNVLVSGNICRNCGEYGLQIHAGDHNTVVNNIFDLSSAGTFIGLYQNDTLLPDHGMAGNVFERNIIYFSGTAPAPLWQVGIASSDVLPTDSTNLYYSASGASISNSGKIVDASPFYANPEFANPSAGDYSMPSSSPAYSLIQFQPLPTDQGPLPYAP
jgi:parallel beta-helix repeat protein